MTKADDSDIAVEYYNVGNAFFEIEQFDKAIQYYEKVLDIDPNFHKARYNLIHIYISKSDFKNANANVNYLASVQDDNLKIKKLAAYVAYSDGELELALELYMDIFERGDTSNEIRLNIVKLYYQLENYKEALFYIDELLLNKEDSDLYYMAGLVASAAGDLEIAVAFYESCIELGGKDKDLLSNTLDIYEQLSDTQNQKIILELIINSTEGDVKSNALYSLAKIYLITDNNFSEGYSSLESAISQGFKNSSKALELLSSPDLIEIDKIRLLFTDNKILE